MIRIEPTDLGTVLQSHPGNRAFAAALDSVASTDDLLHALGQYVYFNATFGGGVANLAGEIAVRQDLFRDSEEPIAALADRSMDVASDIFAAAVDEFDDSATAHRDTHRSLAQATLKAAGQFFAYDVARLSQLFAPNPATRDAIQGMRDGYGLNRALDDAQLFRAIGFHMGSEVLADEEFHLLDNFLRSRYPELVAHLETARIRINGEEHAAYFWIHIHTSVEADHFAFAVQGANRALQYYTAGEAAAAKGWMMEGVAEFAGVQAAFMDGLTVRN